MLEQAIAMRRRLGNAHMLKSSLNNLALASRRLGNQDRAEQLYRESADICRQTEDVRSLGYVLYGLADVQKDRGDYATALTLLRECIMIRHRLGHRPELALTLSAVGETLFYVGDGCAAARMIGAGARLCAEVGMTLSPNGQAQAEDLIARARALAGEDAFGRAWAQGQAMTVDEAVAVALGASH
jgi:tetratricopeptide (TPR) repeat protein